MATGTPSIMWFPLALAAALAFAGHNGMGKRALKELTPLQLNYGAHLVFALSITVLLPVFRLAGADPTGRFDPAYLPFAFTTAALNVIALGLMFSAFRSSPLSTSVPYLSLTPVFVTFTGALLIGERIGAPGILGIVLVAGGSWLLQIGGAGGGLLGPWLKALADPGSRKILLVALIFSVTSVVDKMALLRSNLWLFLFTVAWMKWGLLAVIYRPDPGTTRLRAIGGSLPVGFLFSVEGLVHISAIAAGPVAYVIAVKRTSILFSALLGFTAFRERRDMGIVSGILLMVAGAMVLSVV